VPLRRCSIMSKLAKLGRIGGGPLQVCRNSMCPIEDGSPGNRSPTEHRPPSRERHLRSIRGYATDPLAPLLSVPVTAIDPTARTATLGVRRRQDRRPSVGPAQILVGVTSDGGGLFIIGGKIVRIPPRSPVLRILEALATLQDSESISLGGARDLVQRNALQSISAEADAQLQRMLPIAYLRPDWKEQRKVAGGASRHKVSRLGVVVGG
jgi:hypothetical protein